jgi:hypothetical protein
MSLGKHLGRLVVCTELQSTYTLTHSGSNTKMGLPYEKLSFHVVDAAANAPPETVLKVVLGKILQKKVHAYLKTRRQFCLEDRSRPEGVVDCQAFVKYLTDGSLCTSYFRPTRAGIRWAEIISNQSELIWYTNGSSIEAGTVVYFEGDSGHIVHAALSLGLSHPLTHEPLVLGKNGSCGDVAVMPLSTLKRAYSSTKLFLCKPFWTRRNLAAGCKVAVIPFSGSFCDNTGFLCKRDVALAFLRKPSA